MKMENDGIEKTFEMFNKNLEFNSEKHEYRYAGERMRAVSEILKPYFPFDEEAIASSLRNSNHPVYGGLEVDEIYDIWAGKRDRGTDIHEFAENYLRGEFVTIDSIEKQNVHKYISQQRFDKVITEQKVVSPEWGISGTIDCLYKKDGKYYILDWKTDKRVDMRGYVDPKVKRRKSNESDAEYRTRIDKHKHEKGQKCTGVLSWMDNCNFNKYTMQLNIYRIILETVYDIKIHGMKIAHITPEKVVEYPIPDTTEYAGLVIAQSL